MKVEFAVLFPSVDGQVPRPLSPTELVRILQENKETIGEAVGGTITRITIGNNFYNFIREMQSTRIFNGS